MRKDRYEVVKLIYKQYQLNFVEEFILKKYCPNKMGYTIKVLKNNMRSSKILVRKDKLDELCFLCSNCNIGVRQETTRIGSR